MGWPHLPQPRIISGGKVSLDESGPKRGLSVDPRAGHLTSGRRGRRASIGLPGPGCSYDAHEPHLRLAPVSDGHHPVESPIRLDFGAGEGREPGYTSVDRQPLTNPDIAHDLNVFPYPFADSSIDEVRAFHVIEHLDRPFEAMREIHRILKPGGLLHLKVPHFSRGFTHAEHSHGFDITFPLYFDPSFTTSGYFGVNFDLLSLKLRWFVYADLLRRLKYSRVVIRTLKLADRIITFFANLCPPFATRIWCFWVGGFDEIEMQFICMK